MSTSPFIPPRTIKKIIKLGISESSVLDVFNNGESRKFPNGTPMMVKKYNGYEIGLMYIQDRNTGQYIITSVWKRERR